MLQSWDILASLVAVAMHRRHLMVWAIFAPKFVTDGAMHMVSMLGLVSIRLLALPAATLSEEPAGSTPGPPPPDAPSASLRGAGAVAFARLVQLFSVALRGGLFVVLAAVAWNAFVALVVSG